MKFMLIMRATDEALEASKEIPFEEMLEAMGRYNESLIKAGVMAGGDGLAPAEEGVVVDFSSDPPLVTDGPYGETKELFNGFWILEVSSKEEAVEWAKRCPLGPGSKLEIRRIPGIDEFPEDNEWVQKEKQWLEEAAARGETV
ncbi:MULTISPECIES: YciI family protein [Microbacterium]|uniref:YciI family protein n=1 Tax=Microbacterium TaxID=33882 RepID=UPI00217EA06B|nr:MULTISPECIES: YciI family protein [Microbacterium]UWF77932.1 YciI family protein [Microbacterium neungamense]WCM56109.1 YciI family protein [Microbacterium sp. EF45047]